MDLKELEELKNFNELDLLHKLIEKAEDIKKRTEQILRGNKSAGVDVRKSMQDIRMLSEIIRDLVQRRKFKKNPKEDSKLIKAINMEKKRLLREEARIKKLEEKRTVQR
jgi:small-conductance mechanosensitive channel